MVCSNLGAKYDSIAVDRNLIPEEVKEAITGWRETFNECLFIFGKPGCGKSHILAGLYRAFSTDPSRLSIQCNTINGYLAELQQSIHLCGGTPDLLYKWQRRDLVIIDDFGREKVSDWRIEQLLELIDGRLRDQLPLVISSNLNLEEIQDHFGERISSRLGSGYIVRHNGPDRRI